MLTPAGKRGIDLLLTCGTTLCIFPYSYDPICHCLLKANRKQLAVFLLHKYVAYFITAFSGGRLANAWTSGGHFPIAFKVLNLVFFLAYILTSIAMYQFSTKMDEIRQFFNVILRHVFGDLGRSRSLIRKDVDGSKPGNKNGGKDDPEIEAIMEKGQASTSMSTEIDDEVNFSSRKGVKRLSQFVLMGLLLLAANPSVHVKLVEESPCTPNFLISTVLPCTGFLPQTVPFLYKVPWMIPEYYFTTVMFSSWSFNWVAIFLGMTWMVNRLRGLRNGLLTKTRFNVRAYREAEVAAGMMNDAFLLYLSAFPSLLFAIVSILILGVIRIWHTDPGSNLMFPLCGVRCSFEAITPLAVAGEMNTRNRDLKNVWTKVLIRCDEAKGDTRLGRAELKSLNGVRVTAGSMYTFENSIVLCCLNNCMLLTLNMLVTFRK